MPIRNREVFIINDEASNPFVIQFLITALQTDNVTVLNRLLQPGQVDIRTKKSDAYIRNGCCAVIFKNRNFELSAYVEKDQTYRFVVHCN